jgi:hypothetical protein
MLKSTLLKMAIVCSALLLAGCGQLSEEEKLAAIAPIKVKYAKTLTALKNSDFKSSYLSEDAGIFKDKSLPAYLGASLTIDADDYLIKKYNGSTLLFNNYGVDNYLYVLLSSDTGMSIDSLDERAKTYGFSSAKDMYNYLYNYLHTKSDTDILYTLSVLNKKELIDINKLFNEEDIQKEISKITYTVFRPYIKFENDNNTIRDDWKFKISKKEITFKREDYRTYANLIILMEQLLSKDGTVNLYGI